MKKVQMALIRARLNLQNFLTEDRGDTNFISIMIVLGIVLVIALTFIGFKKQITDAVSTQLTSFLAIFNAQTP